MLTSLNIHNIALIEKCNIRLNKGLNILSGETGAGKSIIIDSLTFVLGARADKTLIRSGENNAVVEAVFEIELDDKIEKCLLEIDIDIESTLIIKRTMNIDGRNECRVNGKMITLGMLRKLTRQIADIYGQHEHQSLLDINNHIELLDSYGDLFKLREEVGEEYNKLNQTKAKLERFGTDSEVRKKIDILQFQIDEIINADIKEDEEQKLIEQRAKYMSAEKIISGVNGAYSLIKGDDSNISSENAIANALSQLGAVTQYDEALSSLYERLESVSIEISDIVSELNDYLVEFDYDEKKADYVERRIDEIRLLKRKYSDNLSKYLENLQEEYDTLINSSDIIDKLNKEYNIIYDELISKCSKLSQSRLRVARKFEKEIIMELNDLGMKGTTFKVNIFSSKSNITTIGYDTVEFLISPNVGEPLKSLNKIISGGEMSRFMLAIKNITARLDNIDCMVFDEIDSGISGRIAQVVAEKLCNISRDRQVIAVTHLPQLSAMADYHFLIEKIATDKKTITKLTLLDNESSVKEIARLIGGSDYSGHALPHAREMLEYSNNYKLSLN